MRRPVIKADGRDMSVTLPSADVQGSEVTPQQYSEGSKQVSHGNLSQSFTRNYSKSAPKMAPAGKQTW